MTAALIQVNSSTWRYDYDSHFNVEVGDISQPQFKPTFKINRWGGECSFKLPFPVPGGNASASVNGRVVSWSNSSGWTARFYDIDPGGQNENGGFEFELIFPSAPPSNVFAIPIDTANLAWFYQPELTPDEIARGNVRPPNVVGSYAVYHLSKSVFHKVPGDASKYLAGKAFHFYRPELIDSLGARAWCDIDVNVATSTLTLTLPAAFLASATYPVTLDPTIGYNVVGSSQDDTNNFLLTTKFTSSDAGDANPGTVFVACDMSSGTGTVACCTYNDDGGTPPSGATKDSSDATVSIDTTVEFKSSSFTWTGIAASTNYWLALNNVVNGRTRYDTSTGTIYYVARTHSNDMPTTLTTTGNFSGRISMYVDYSAGGATAGLPVLKFIGLGATAIANAEATAGISTVSFLGLQATAIANAEATAGISTASFIGLEATAVANAEATAGISTATFKALEATASGVLTAGISVLTFKGLEATAIANAEATAGIATLSFLGLESTVTADAEATAGISTTTFTGLEASVTNLEAIGEISIVTFRGLQATVTANAEATAGISTLSFSGLQATAGSGEIEISLSHDVFIAVNASTDVYLPVNQSHDVFTPTNRSDDVYL